MYKFITFVCVFQFFVLCHGMLQLSQLLVSGYLKGSITSIERRYGFSSQMMGLLAAFNEARIKMLTLNGANTIS